MDAPPSIFCPIYIFHVLKLLINVFNHFIISYYWFHLKWIQTSKTDARTLQRIVSNVLSQVPQMLAYDCPSLPSHFSPFPSLLPPFMVQT